MNTDLLHKKEKIYSTIKVIIAVIIAFLLLIPIYTLFISSIKTNASVFDMRLVPNKISFEGYIYALKENFLQYFCNSLIIATTVTIIALVFHSMSGYTLARLRFKGKKLVFLWIISTLMVPFSVTMIPLFILVKKFNWLNTYKGVIIPAIPHAYGIFLFRQFFMTIPKELEEAATIDGCSPFGTYYRIFLPLAKPVTLTLAVAFFIANWNNYLWPLIVNQKPDMLVLQVAVANFIGRTGSRWDAVMAAGVITVLPSIVLFFIFQRHLVNGIKTSGLK